jgi:polyvinyl alcohol dehydrogenase (cytochrome)
MKQFFGALKSLAVVVFALTSSASAQTVAGLRLYEQNCATCHGNPSGPRNSPDGTQLRKLSAEAVYQATNNSANCPKELGPDFDSGSSPILRTPPDGRRILIAGQKSGMVWGHDIDNRGAVVWKAQLVDKRALGMSTSGGAADDQHDYFGLRNGGVASVQLATGEKKWSTPEDDSHSTIQLHGQTAAVTAIPGVVFSGGWDGMLQAYSTDDGRLLWEYDTAREFTAVNAVAAKGGSMGAAGPVVAGGMLFAGSGYVFGAGTPGNVLLVFGVN